MNDKMYRELLALIETLKKEVEQIKQSQTDEEWLDSADLKLRFNFSESKLYHLRKTNQIPFIPIGGRYYYPKSYFYKALLQKIKEKERAEF